MAEATHTDQEVSLSSTNHPDERSRGTGNTSRAIIQAALDLFSIQGYEGTTMRQIASQVGVKPASLYNHHTSKQSILDDICRRTMEELLSGQSKAFAGGAETREDVTTALRSFIEMHTAFHIQERQATRIVNQLLGRLEEPRRTHAFDMRDTYEHKLRELIDRGVDLGIFDVSSSRLASYAILAMGMHLSVWYQEDGSLSPEEIIEDHVALGFQILGVPRSR